MGARTYRFLLLAALFVSIVSSRSVEAQCAMCRTALESSEEGQAMAAKLNRGILILLGAPFGVALAVATAMRGSRRSRLRPGAPPLPPVS
jgi:hypothetical protein